MSRYWTGFVEFDWLTGGLQPSHLVAVASRPTQDKTFFGLNLAVTASQTGKRTIFFSLNKPRREIETALLSAGAMVRFSKIAEGNLNEYERRKIAEAKKIRANIPLRIEPCEHLTIGDIEEITTNSGNIDLVVIDYLQLIENERNTEDRIAETTRQLKILARKLNIPIVALSQWNHIPPPDIKDPVECLDRYLDDPLVQDSDIILLLYRDDNTLIVEVDIAKRRDGPTGKIKLGYLSEYRKFVNIK